MTFYYYDKCILHYCNNTKSYRNVYTKKKFKCPGCGLQVPWVLTMGEEHKNKTHLIALGKNSNYDNLPIGAKKIDFEEL